VTWRSSATGSGRTHPVGFGAAQLDRYANINTTVIGPYEKPKVRLPGAGGAPEIAALAGSAHRHAAESSQLRLKLDFVTSVGHGDGGDAPRAWLSAKDPRL
jgi:glutaconate CoA-transferase subunit B